MASNYPTTNSTFSVQSRFEPLCLPTFWLLRFAVGLVYIRVSRAADVMLLHPQNDPCAFLLTDGLLESCPCNAY